MSQYITYNLLVLLTDTIKIIKHININTQRDDFIQTQLSCYLYRQRAFVVTVQKGPQVPSFVCSLLRNA